MDIMNVSEIMDRGITILKKYLGKISLFSLVYGIILIILFIGVNIFASLIFIPVLMYGAGRGIGSILYFVVLIAGVVGAFSSLSVGIIQISSHEFVPQQIGLDSTIGNSLKSIPKVVGIMIVDLLIFSPIILISYFLYPLLDISWDIIGLIKMKAIFAIFISLIIIIVALIIFLLFTSVFYLSICVATVEKCGVFAATKRSFWLMKNYIWKIAGSMFVFQLTAYAIRTSLESFFVLLGSIVYIIMELLNIQEDYMILFNLSRTVSSIPLLIISWLIISPMSTIMMTLLYYNQRFKKEGYDMELRLIEMEKQEVRN